MNIRFVICALMDFCIVIHICRFGNGGEFVVMIMSFLKVGRSIAIVRRIIMVFKFVVLLGRFNSRLSESLSYRTPLHYPQCWNCGRKQVHPVYP